MYVNSTWRLSHIPSAAILLEWKETEEATEEQTEALVVTLLLEKQEEGSLDEWVLTCEYPDGRIIDWAGRQIESWLWAKEEGFTL